MGKIAVKEFYDHLYKSGLEGFPPEKIIMILIE